MLTSMHGQRRAITVLGQSVGSTVLRVDGRLLAADLQLVAVGSDQRPLVVTRSSSSARRRHRRISLGIYLENLELDRRDSGFVLQRTHARCDAEHTVQYSTVQLAAHTNRQN